MVVAMKFCDYHMEGSFAFVNEIEAIPHKIFIGITFSTASVVAPMKLRSYSCILSQKCDMIFNF